MKHVVEIPRVLDLFGGELGRSDNCVEDSTASGLALG